MSLGAGRESLSCLPCSNSTALGRQSQDAPSAPTGTGLMNNVAEWLPKADDGLRFSASPSPSNPVPRKLLAILEFDNAEAFSTFGPLFLGG